MEINVVEHDFSVGGRWKYTMNTPDGNQFVTEGVYSVIVALEKIFSLADFKPMTEGVEIQALFEASGDKTNFTFNCIHTTEAYCKQQEQVGFYSGWGSVFDRLETFVSALHQS